MIITLNASGLLDLNANQGGQFIFGGAVSGTLPDVYSFGGTVGTPPALLNLDQSAVTPEPSSVVLFGTGLVGIILITRKMLFA